MVKRAQVVNQARGRDAEKQAWQSLVSIFADIPFLELKKSETDITMGNQRADIVLDALVSGKAVKLVVEVKSQGEPRLVRMAVPQLKDCLKRFKGSYGILVAPYFSDASRQICKEAGVGCIDFAGNAFISFKNIYIDRGGIPNPFAVPRISKSVFSPKSSRVLRVLLSDPARRWYVEDLSREAGISIGLTSRVKQALLSEEWVKADNKRFYLSRPEEALSQWVNNYSYEKNQAFSYYSELSEDRLEAAIKIECEKRKYRYGLALFSGARRVAPFVRFMKFFSYIEEDIETISEALQMKRVESGANVTLFRPYDEGIFYGLQNIGGINVVSDIQLYLDLKSYRGRGEEAAQAIFDQRIKAKW